MIICKCSVFDNPLIILFVMLPTLEINLLHYFPNNNTHHSNVWKMVAICVICTSVCSKLIVKWDLDLSNNRIMLMHRK